MIVLRVETGSQNRDIAHYTRRAFEGVLFAVFAGSLFWSAVGVIGAALEWW